MAITERDLSSAMAAAGRPISIVKLGEWRKGGLLPPYVSRSHGLNKGKYCFWEDDTTFDRAILIYDLLKDGVDKHTVYWVLWLCGFPIPLAHVRRAWLHLSKRRNAFSADRAAGSSRCADPIAHQASLEGTDDDALSAALFRTAWAACGVLNENFDVEIDALVAACDRVWAKRTSRARRSRPAEAELRRRLRLLLKSVWSAARSSDLVGVATDAEMREAQRHVSGALRIFQGSESTVGSHVGGAIWPLPEAMSFGAPLFFFILVMVKSGESGLLDKLAQEFAGKAEPSVRVAVQVAELAR